RHAVALNPRNAEAHRLLGVVLGEQGRPVDSARHHARAMILDAAAAEANGAPAALPPHDLARAHLVLGEVAGAAEVYRRWAEAEPGNPSPRLHLAACTGREVPDRCPPEYVEAAFDAFAPTFDEKLGHLGYRGPELLAEALRAVLPPPPEAGSLDVLDAACGTGLCGPVLRPYAARLSGIDLSGGMLARAAVRQVYDALAKGDLAASLRERPAAFDLVACIDALIYLGSLGEAFAAAAAALRPGGLFLFTIELPIAGEAPSEGRVLAPVGRFRHGKAHVGAALRESRFRIVHEAEAPLRRELGEPVAAWIVAARRDDS
ncbi:MAG TPA: methyltransferase domain-containing protein, partial [Candidatus Methylacidiphilales bacterium]